MSLSSPGSSLAVQWLGLCALIVKGEGSFPGQGTEILQATCHSSPPKKKIFLYSELSGKVSKSSTIKSMTTCKACIVLPLNVIVDPPEPAQWGM